MVNSVQKGHQGSQQQQLQRNFILVKLLNSPRLWQCTTQNWILHGKKISFRYCCALAWHTLHFAYIRNKQKISMQTNRQLASIRHLSCQLYTLFLNPNKKRTKVTSTRNKTFQRTDAISCLSCSNIEVIVVDGKWLTARDEEVEH